MNIQDIRKAVIGKLALLEKCERELSAVQTEVREVQYRQQNYAEATQILRDLYEQTQERFHGQIMQIVSYCLKEVFGDDAYQFKIVFEQKRNQVESRFVFCRNGEEFENPLLISGGGPIDVAVFALRLAVVYLTRNTLRGIIILDEPFRYLSAEFRPKVAVLLDKLSAEFDFQFIIVTHIPELAIGKVYQFAR